MKLKIALLTMVLSLMVFCSGCAKDAEEDATPSVTPAPTAGVTDAATTPEATPEVTAPAATSAADATPDAVTTASIVADEEAFINAIGKNGTWIICLTKDISTDKELLMEGEYKNGKKDDAGKDIIQRKLALYAQDENRTITERYTLTAPKLTVTSPMASIQHGTFKGDLYVSVSDFQLIDSTVDGNVYFTTEEAKSTFKMDEDSKVTGKQELKK